MSTLTKHWNEVLVKEGLPVDRAKFLTQAAQGAGLCLQYADGLTENASKYCADLFGNTVLSLAGCGVRLNPNKYRAASSVEQGRTIFKVEPDVMGYPSSLDYSRLAMEDPYREEVQVLVSVRCNACATVQEMLVTVDKDVPHLGVVFSPDFNFQCVAHGYTKKGQC